MTNGTTQAHVSKREDIQRDIGPRGNRRSWIVKFQSSAILMVMVVSALVVSPMAIKPAAAAPITITIGTTESQDTFNPFSMMSGVSWMIAWEMYEVLVTRDPTTLQPLPMLAQSWEVSPDGKVWTFHLAQNSVWHDNTPVTAEDVNWTFNFMMDHPKEGGLYQGYIKNIIEVVALDTYTVRFTSDVPKATMLSMNVPILPKHLWSAVPLTQIGNVDLWNTKYFPNGPVGSGPMILSSYDKTLGDIWMLKWSQYHMGTINVDQVLYKMFTSEDAMMSSLYSGSINLAMQVPSSLWNSTIDRSDIEGQVANQLDMHHLGFNCASPSTRFATDGAGHPLFPKASTNIETWNVSVRRASAMAINKTEIVSGILNGLADEGTTVVPPITPFWRYNVTEEKIRFDPAAARALLDAAGFRDTDGDGVRENVSSPSSELRFNFYYPTGYAADELAAQKIDGWLADIGISAPATSISETVLFSYQYNMKYDMFFWSWWPEIDPSFILSVLTTGEIADNNGDWSAWSDTFYSNPTYDSLYAQQQTAVNLSLRQSLVHQMQSIAYHDSPYIVMWYPYSLFAYRFDRFTNFPDFRAQPGATPDNFWFFMQITPLAGNVSPNFDAPLNPIYSPIVNTLATFQVQISDDDGDQLWVNWTFGDGTPGINQVVPAGTTSTPVTLTQTHTYTVLNPTPGYTLNVTLTDGHAGHEKTTTAQVSVIERPDYYPQFTSQVSPSPASAYNDTLVTWFVNASDHESGGPAGFGLRFTWDWGDGQFTVSNHQPTVNDVPVADWVSHSWPDPATYDVRVWVWDGVDAPWHNVSSGVISYLVEENTAPSTPVISPISGTEGMWIGCVASSVDADPDSLRFTWDWGDGTFNVTNHAPNQDVQTTSSVRHQWPTTGAPATYPVIVWVDDGINYAGHNVSASVNADIVPAGVNVPPTELLIVNPPLPAYTNEDLVFNTSAVDSDGDELVFCIEFGDGTSAVATLPSGETAKQYVDFTHSYSATDTYTVTLWVNDSTGPADHNSTTTTSLVVTENSPPVILLPSSLYAGYNRTFTVTPTQCKDSDGDLLEIWYEWGDGSPMTQGGGAASYYAGTHVYSALGNRTLNVSVDDGTGLPGHNVTVAAIVKVSEANLKPEVVGVIEKSPSKTSYEKNETITFKIVVRDYEGDNMTLTVEFGDGAKQVLTIDAADIEPDSNVTRNVTHAYAAGRIASYAVNATVEDDQDHSDMSWNVGHTSVLVPSEEVTSKGIPLALIAGIAIAAIFVVVALLLLMRRRKKAADAPMGEAPPAPPS